MDTILTYSEYEWDSSRWLTSVRTCVNIQICCLGIRLLYVEQITRIQFMLISFVQSFCHFLVLCIDRGGDQCKLYFITFRCYAGPKLSAR